MQQIHEYFNQISETQIQTHSKIHGSNLWVTCHREKSGQVVTLAVFHGRAPLNDHSPGLG